MYKALLMGVVFFAAAGAMEFFMKRNTGKKANYLPWFIAAVFYSAVYWYISL